jgi:hypothetical protein
MKQFNFNTESTIAVLSDSGQGATLELTLTGWNGQPAKYDIRHWNTKDNERKAYKGVSLTADELKALYIALQGIYEK